MAVPSRVGGVIAALGGGGAVKARQSVTVCAELDKGMDEKVDRDLLAGTEEFFAMLAGYRISKHHAGFGVVDPSGCRGRVSSRSR